MYKIQFFLVFLIVSILTACSSGNKETNTIPLIPMPAEIKYKSGSFNLDENILIAFNNVELKQLAENLTSYLHAKNINSIIYSIDSISSKNLQTILLVLDNNSLHTSEGYTLSISDKNITITAPGKQGIFYGIQTLSQLINNTFSGKNNIPCLKIKDDPRFAWRGMHLDVSRHFMPIEFIKKYIDYLAYLKMNIFHWHLVDDQGWRIEIKKYPKLTESGAWRDETIIGHIENQPWKFDGKRYGGYYTQDDIKEIVAYAEDRFITIVPEIEMPGHSQAAIASYPELGCTSENVKTMTFWGISPYNYNSDEKTFKFLEDVLEEVITLFPSKYIHIGGDEVLKDQWESSEKIQAFMKSEGITDENALQSYFVNRIAKFLSSKGRIIIGWDEILVDGIQADAAIMSWRGENGGIDAARKGHHVVMTPTDFCYFDRYQDTAKTEPLAIGGFLPLATVYSYNPVPLVLDEAESKFIMGVQGNVWTEYLDSPEKVEYILFPRIFAMAEIQWTPQQKKSYPGFLLRLQYFEQYLIENNINYAKHAFTKNLKSNPEN